MNTTTRGDIDDLLALARVSHEIVTSAHGRPTPLALKGLDAAIQDAVFMAILNVLSWREFQQRRMAIRASSRTELAREMRRVWGELCRGLHEG